MQLPRRLFLALGLVGLTGWFTLGSATPADRVPSVSKPLALVGGLIRAQTDGDPVEFVGTVLVRDGKIAAVGSNVAVPADAERMDVKGLVVTPGLIDARSTLWLSPAATREGASDGGLNVLDEVNPHSEDWKEVLRQGVTAVYVQPAATGILGGRGAVMRVGPADTVEELVIQADAAAQAALGTAAAPAAPASLPTFPGRFGGEPPTAAPAAPTGPTGSGNSLARYAQYEQLKRALEGVRRSPDDARKGPPTKGGLGGATSRPRRDPAREFLGRVLKGEIPLRLEAHRQDDIHNALRLADELKLRLVLDGVSNPGTAADEITRRRVPLVLGPFVELEEAPTYRAEQPLGQATGRRGGGRRQPTAAPAPAQVRSKQPVERSKAIPAQEGRWALGTFSDQPRGSRLLRVQAAAAVSQGMDATDVLRAMTRSAAEILGVADRLGTIAPGKQAELAVFAGDPLDPSVAVRLVISGGRVVYQAEGPVTRSQPAPVSSPHTLLPSRLPPKYALQTKRLLTEDGTFRPGTVLVDSGRVTAIGSSAAANGLPVFDLDEAVVAPGLVAGHNDLGMAAAIDDPAEADAGQVRAGDVFDPEHRAVRKLLEGGFTAVLYSPGSANVWAGTCSGVRLGSEEPVGREVGMKLVLSASSRGASRAAAAAEDPLTGFLGASRGPARYPASLAGQVELIELVLAGKGDGTELYLPGRIRQQIRAERRRNVGALIERKQVAFFEARSRAEVHAALRVIERFQLRGVLIGPDEVKPFLEDIKRLGVGIVARPVQAADHDRPLRELAKAAAAGVQVAFGGSAVEARMTAALAVNAGMPREAAWRALTMGAARLTGMPDSAGRLMVGGNADLGIWTGSPLDLCSRPLQVVVNGKLVHAGP